jgi:hypothetical protein
VETCQALRQIPRLLGAVQMSFVARFKCPACSVETPVVLTSELLKQAAERDATRALARCPRGHAAVLTVDQYGNIRSAPPVYEQAELDCEITDKTPVSVRPRLAAICLHPHPSPFFSQPSTASCLSFVPQLDTLCRPPSCIPPQSETPRMDTNQQHTTPAEVAHTQHVAEFPASETVRKL